MAGPLAGLRILDLTTVLMGPFATQVLGDLGAEVTKVEPPEGDPVRHLGPWRNPGMSACFLHVNRNKRSVVLDLKQSEDRQAVLALAADADVFVTNVRPAAMARLRLSYEDVVAAHPGIIYVALVGYGQNGPYADRAAYDDMIQAACAIPSLIAQLGEGVPRYVPLAIVDRVVGQAAATAILAACLHKLRTGRGQYVEIPMFETMAPYVLAEHLSGHTYLPPIGEPGYRRLLASSRQAYATRDGHVCTMVYSDRQWRSFFALIGQPDRCTTDPRLADMGSRTRHIAELYAEVAAALKEQTTAYWLEALSNADIPVMPLHDLHSIQDDPHLKAVGFFREVEHPTEGPMVELAPMGRWSDSPPDPPRPAPTLGENSEQILSRLRGRKGPTP